MRLRTGKEIWPAPPGPVGRRRRGSPFLHLPVELRIIIYRYIFGFHVVQSEWFSDWRNRRKLVRNRRMRYDWHDSLRRAPHLIALLQTCKLVSQESLPVLYDQTQFHPTLRKLLQTWRDAESSFDWPEGPEALAWLKHIRHLEIYFCPQFRIPFEIFEERVRMLASGTSHGRDLKTLHISFYTKERLLINPRMDSRAILWFIDQALRFTELRGTLVMTFEEAASATSKKELFKKMMDATQKPYLLAGEERWDWPKSTFKS